MGGAGARRTRTGSSAEPGDAAIGADEASERRRATAPGDAAPSLEVDDDRDIFGDAGLGRVDDEGDRRAYLARGDEPAADDGRR